MAPSTVNVAALHLLKKREAKSRAEFFKLDDTRRMGESGQDVAAFGCVGIPVANVACSKVIALLVTVLPPLNRAVSTAVAAVEAVEAVAAVSAVAVATGTSEATGVALTPSPGSGAGPGPCPGAVITGVAEPGARRRGGIDGFDMLHERVCYISLVCFMPWCLDSLDIHLTLLLLEHILASL